MTNAIKELEIAAKASPKLPFVHFNLGEADMKKQEFEKARGLNSSKTQEFSRISLGALF